MEGSSRSLNAFLLPLFPYSFISGFKFGFANRAVAIASKISDRKRSTLSVEPAYAIHDVDGVLPIERLMVDERNSAHKQRPFQLVIETGCPLPDQLVLSIRWD